MANVSLHKHLRVVIDERDVRYQQRFDAQEQAMQAALVATREAITKAEAATNARLALLNEFRAQAEQQAKDYPRVETVNARFGALEKDFAGLVARIERREGHSGGLNAGWGYLAGALGIAIGLTGVIASIILQ